MTHEALTTLSPADVLASAKAFFSERIPHNSAYPETQGPGFLTLRGQGGEEIALAVFLADGLTRVRASTLFFDQAVGRFLSTLPGKARVA